ncbi:MAG: hypothetical protein II955_04445 [Clostridia bacterium]|nr:hypothetical protein [Clostridia bacterium]
MKRTENTPATSTAAEFAELWAGWKITPEQIERIRAQDWGACAEFYEANLERLRKLAHGYARAKREQGFGDKWNADDLLQDLYIDLPLLDWDTEQAFKSSMNKHSFFFSGHGGFSYLLQHCPNKIGHKDYREEPLLIVDQRAGEDEDGESLLDLVAAARSVPEEMDEERERERLARMEADLSELLREILTPKQCEAWSAGRNPQTVADRLKANAATVCAFLAAHGTAPERLRGKVESE